MPSPFSDQLSPLFKSLASQVKERDVLCVVGTLALRDWTARKRLYLQEILAWAVNRVEEELPAAAYEGRSFFVPKGGRSVDCVAIETGDNEFWGIRLDDPDDTIAGRTWSTEIVVGGQKQGLAKFSLRLRLTSSGFDQNFFPTVPGIVGQLIENIGLHSATTEFHSSARTVFSEGDCEKFVEHLENVERKSPIIALAQMPNSSLNAVDPHALAKAVQGMGHVYRLNPAAGYYLSERYGSAMSVFDGGVRVYFPDAWDAPEPSHHRLFTRHHLNETGGKAFIRQEVQRLVARDTLRRFTVGKEIVPFAQLKSISNEIRSQNLAEENAPDRDIISALQAQIDGKKAEIAELKSQEQDATENWLDAAQDLESSRSENARLVAKIQSLNSALEATGQHVSRSPIPSLWQDVGNWIEMQHAGKIAITPTAKRGLKKAEFHSVETVCKCINWLAEKCRSTFIDGGGSLRDIPVLDGIINAPCGGDEYEFKFYDSRFQASWHIKNNGNTRDPKRCLRIYYGWDAQNQLIIVSDLPAHRKTSMS